MAEDKAEDKYSFIKGLWQYMTDKDNKIGSKIGNQKERKSKNLDSIAYDERPEIGQYGPESVAFGLSRATDMAGDAIVDQAGKYIAKPLIKKGVEKAGYKALAKVAEGTNSPDTAIKMFERSTKDDAKKASNKLVKDNAASKLDDVAKSVNHGDLDKGIKTGRFVPLDDKSIKSSKNNVLKEAQEMLKASDNIASLYSKTSDTAQAEIDDLLMKYAERYSKTSTGKARPSKTIARMAQRDPTIQQAINDIITADFSHRLGSHADNVAKVSEAILPAHIMARTGTRVLSDAKGEGRNGKNVSSWNYVDFDPKLEKGKLWHAIQNFTNGLGINYLGDQRIDKDEVKELVHILNDNDEWGKFKNRFQINGLSDWELVQFIMDASAGKYDDEDTNLSYELREARRKQREDTNNVETKE